MMRFWTKVDEKFNEAFGVATVLAEVLASKLRPASVKECWNKSAAFTFAMQRAKAVYNDYVNGKV